MKQSPFAVLGLDPLADLSDDEVRAAWRRIAAATHPDRADGGDPARFAAAASAYTDLRTRSGRGEARAALADAGSSRASGPRSFARTGEQPRVPARLVFRLAIIVAAGAIAVLVAGQGPARPALATGAVTWFALTIWSAVRH